MLMSYGNDVLVEGGDGGAAAMVAVRGAAPTQLRPFGAVSAERVAV